MTARTPFQTAAPHAARRRHPADLLEAAPAAVAEPTVLHVTATLGHGGTESLCRDLVAEMRRTGTNHVAALAAGSGALRPAFERLADSVEVLPPARAARLAAFARTLRRTRPDAVLFHVLNAEQALLALVARGLGVARLAAAAGNPAPAPGEPRRRTWRWLLRAERALGCPVISASRWVEASLAALGPLPPGSRVVLNACDTNQIARRAQASRRSRDDTRFVIVMVARLDAIKDHATLLEAVARLRGRTIRSTGRTIELRLIGDGPLEARLRSQVRTLGLSASVLMLGASGEVPEHLGRADAFVLSTTAREGFGIALIEALAAGVPVIASDVPACREVLEDGRLGTLVPPGDPAALAEALGRLLDAAERADPPRLPALESVARRYGIERLHRDYAAVLGLPWEAPA
jgi:glycosyltransferase involved in cell wall biosynthesis